VIRQVGADDWQLLRDVRLRALQDAPYAFLTTYADASGRPDSFWREWAARTDGGATFVAERDGRFDGIVGCFETDEPGAVVLVAMWVAPELRGSGAAAGLVERVVEWARGRGAARVVLTVEAGNHSADRLYRRCGFVEAGDVRLPYEPNPGSRNLELRL
jgi:GNAT superfamily N-acetyltransferase